MSGSIPGENPPVTLPEPSSSSPPTEIRTRSSSFSQTFWENQTKSRCWLEWSNHWHKHFVQISEQFWVLCDHPYIFLRQKSAGISCWCAARQTNFFHPIGCFSSKGTSGEVKQETTESYLCCRCCCWKPVRIVAVVDSWAERCCLCRREVASWSAESPETCPLLVSELMEKKPFMSNCTGETISFLCTNCYFRYSPHKCYFSVLCFFSSIWRSVGKWQTPSAKE